MKSISSAPSGRRTSLYTLWFASRPTGSLIHPKSIKRIVINWSFESLFLRPVVLIFSASFSLETLQGNFLDPFLHGPACRDIASQLLPSSCLRTQLEAGVSSPSPHPARLSSVTFVSGSRGDRIKKASLEVGYRYEHHSDFPCSFPSSRVALGWVIQAASDHNGLREKVVNGSRDSRSIPAG